MITTYAVEGMTCNHCASAISSEVGEVAGVTEATVDLEAKQLTVTSDSEIDFAQISEAVSEAGDYTVAPAA